MCTATTIEDLAKATRRRTPLCSKRVAVSATIGVFVTSVACAYSSYRIRESERDFMAIQRSQLQSTGQQLLSGVQRQLETSVSSTKALNALIQLDEAAKLMEPEADLISSLINKSATLATLEKPTPEEKASAEQAKRDVASLLVNREPALKFNKVAASLIATYKGLSNLQLAPAGIVSVIHPIRGNEGAIGHDLFYDPNRREAAMETIRQGSIVFVGPVTLIQNGKRAIIARNPTFIDRPGYVGPVPEFPSWWGFATMLCTLEDLFAATSLSQAGAFSISYLLVANTPRGVMFLSASTDVHIGDDADKDGVDWQAFVDKYDPIQVSFSLPELRVHWTLKVWPTGGWQAAGGATTPRACCARLRSYSWTSHAGAIRLLLVTVPFGHWR